ncbi:uncharacterized protein TrAtP1_010432 [Trichoderma atroviride]|uniref:uncharacterized protein n=1 Tax=Hypocrea atroviridis TaxID=63577 RepID=UPI00332593C9|nr:hypothetical protein TrAtP1_010432 [Trichoderma atroviride]
MAWLKPSSLSVLNEIARDTDSSKDTCKQQHLVAHRLCKCADILWRRRRRKARKQSSGASRILSPRGRRTAGRKLGEMPMYSRLPVDYMYSIDAYSRPGRGTRARRLVLGVMGPLVDAGIAGHSGDIVVGSWPCILSLYHYLELDPP